MASRYQDSNMPIWQTYEGINFYLYRTVVVIDVVRNFGRKYAKSLEIILKDYPKDMREKKLATADAFGRLVLDRCRLNMLADTLRPLFEEAHRTKSYQRLKDLNVPSALSVVRLTATISVCINLQQDGYTLF